MTELDIHRRLDTRLHELEVRLQRMHVRTQSTAEADPDTNGCTYGCTHGCTNGCTGATCAGYAPIEWLDLPAGEVQPDHI